MKDIDYGLAPRPHAQRAAAGASVLAAPGRATRPPDAGTAAALAALDRATRASHRALLRTQDPDGSWRYALEGSSVLPDAHFILANRLYHFLSQEDEARLVERIRSRQLPDGGWPLYPGDAGHLSSSVEAYFALRLHGLAPKSDALRRARRFIADHGGLARVSSLTRVTLAVLGQMSWSEVPLLPIEILLLPRRSPFNLFSFVSFTRIHLVSIMVLGELAHQVKPGPVDLEKELDGPADGRPRAAARWHAPTLARQALARVTRYVDRAKRLLAPAAFRTRSLQVAKEYLLSHQEPDGSWGNYILSTFWGLLAMQALGCPADSAVIRRGVAGLKALLWRRDGEHFVQPCNSAVWSTAVIAYCLQETGLAADHPALAGAARWLLDSQSFRAGDWQVRCPLGPTGNWGFQDGNALFPDVDDTIAAVRAILPAADPGDFYVADACRRGEQWALAMQNPDGGWSSFDRNCRSWWLERIPFNDMYRAMTDPSTADMTGRMLEFLGVRGRRAGEAEVDAALRWLARNQERDGSWFGRWGIAYVYGTWAALMGVGAVRGSVDDPMVARAVAWLESVQNADGGWGESCQADTAGKYVALGESTPSQSAWGLAGLVSVARGVTPAIRRGIDYLLRAQSGDGTWPETYTTGAGFAGKLYLDYRFYKDAWPLQALGLARNLVERGSAWGA